MALRIHNTLTGRKENFVPVEEGKVRMYVCGVTVYDDIHMGHARSMIVFFSRSENGLMALSIASLKSFSFRGFRT